MSLELDWLEREERYRQRVTRLLTVFVILVGALVGTGAYLRSKHSKEAREAAARAAEQQRLDAERKLREQFTADSSAVANRYASFLQATRRNRSRGCRSSRSHYPPANPPAVRRPPLDGVRAGDRPRGDVRPGDRLVPAELRRRIERRAAARPAPCSCRSSTRSGSLSRSARRRSRRSRRDKSRSGCASRPRRRRPTHSAWVRRCQQVAKPPRPNRARLRRLRARAPKLRPSPAARPRVIPRGDDAVQPTRHRYRRSAPPQAAPSEPHPRPPSLRPTNRHLPRWLRRKRRQRRPPPHPPTRSRSPSVQSRKHTRRISLGIRNGYSSRTLVGAARSEPVPASEARCLGAP